MSVAMVCLVHTVAAQSNFNPNLHRLVASVTGSLSIRFDDPIPAGKGKLLLQWGLSKYDLPGFYNIERSSYKQGPYDVLAVIRQDSGLKQFTDEQPLKGNSYYRIRWVPENGFPQYSRIVSSSFAGDMTCKFYPNPVDNILIIRSEQDLELLLTDGNGKIFTNVKLKSGLQTVDVSNLDKGLYIITLTQAESGRAITQKLIKN